MALVLDDNSTSDIVERFVAAVDGAIEAGASRNDNETSARVSFDCEGVNLSRAGSMEIVSLYVESGGAAIEEAGTVFLVDLGGSQTTKRSERIATLKRLFECKEVEKIIHDCKMDCDALFHCCGIRVHNVHDTSCFHAVNTGQENKNLNDVLAYN
jgi:DNA polymerase I-like protein with 3'-5' exonuclease and polymerase domains